MNTLDEISAGADTVMTPALVRLFKAAGCHPTLCHACRKRITTGKVFKLMPHRKAGEKETRDEMLCASCGKPELVERDRKAAESAARFVFVGRPHNGVRFGGGFSRPSLAKL